MQVGQGTAGYGLVLALQVTVPCTRLTLVQSLSAEYPDHPRQMFRLEVSDIQTAVALEDKEQDIRSAKLAAATAAAATTAAKLHCCSAACYCSVLSCPVLLCCSEVLCASLTTRL